MKTIGRSGGRALLANARARQASSRPRSRRRRRRGTSRRGDRRRWSATRLGVRARLRRHSPPRRRAQRRRRERHEPPSQQLSSRAASSLRDRDAGRRFGVPDAVERPKGISRLVVRATGRRRHDHRGGASEAELEADVIRPEPRDFPVDERHLAADVEAVELPPATAPDDDELPWIPPSRVFREHRRTTRIRSAYRRPARQTRLVAATRRPGPVPQ